ncbi:haloacid dehalogenase type II [Salibacterium halotolerans]|uniref:2-haloacid dehalogenase n=1 Tax=Salibacterium halotolerans TaxID=1884432 RepID=A0A1I5TD75_9BACI|nr:haloacid dehalogenase type II [Salibacterium halotolerans]SFP80928.1 2-haloacid dehalogenase [Salibacterium halotolerans]
MQSHTYVFDVYGTLFDVHSITAACERAAGEKGEALSRIWREKQIQYTFLRQAMGRYRSFEQVTRDALRYASASVSTTLSEDTENTLMKAYQSLDLFPESSRVLQTLKQNGRSVIVFSNGTRDMLEPLLRNGGIRSFIDAVISVDDIKQYKPSPASYQLILDEVHARRSDITFLSSNGWDISGAEAFGFTTAWVNRSGAPVEELQLPPDAEWHSLSPLEESTS